MNSYVKSQQLYDRACRVLAGGVSSEFRRFAQPCPLFYERGEGSRIWDVDGNEYLDFTLSQGPLIVGHSHPHVLSRVEEASRSGQIFAGQHLLELELAEKLQSLIPSAELLRFSLSGSESDHAALRLARGATGREKILRFEGHYHGWFDSVAPGIAGQNVWTQGLPSNVNDDIILLPWNDLVLVEKTVAERHDEIAAIITEPVMCNSGCIPPQPGFLEGLRALCDRYGIIFILDEVITGFRLGLGGAQQYFNVTPDLAIFGKAMASGYPISILCGKRQAHGKPLMDLVAEGKVIHAGTMNSGNPCVAAALGTIEVLERDNTHEKLFRLGNQLIEGLRTAAAKTNQNLLVQGMGPMLHTGFTDKNAVLNYADTLSYDKAKGARFIGGLQERGIRVIGRGLWYISNAHTEADIERAIQTVGEVLSAM
jgi:glutamate-1-semialdehyde 2,1-aminomutase